MNVSSVYDYSLDELMKLKVVSASKDEESRSEKLFSDIKRYIETADLELEKAIIDQIENEPNGVAKQILEEINEPNIAERPLTVYVWAIGFTKDTIAIDKLIKIHGTTNSKIVKYNARHSLAKIGGTKAGDYLISKAKTAGDDDKFEILNSLGLMQYEPAIPVMGELLKKDHKKYYWQSFFCFGRMGDKAVPYLLKKINDKDKNVRFHSIHLLGYVLTATEAAEPLAARYWEEKDNDVKMFILKATTKIIPDFVEMKKFLENVHAKEKDEALKQFAEQGLILIDNWKTKVKEFKERKEDNRAIFEAEYKALYKSSGWEGDMQKLASHSRLEDEPRLKKLREKILSLGSDECFYYYEQTNEIIMYNRLIPTLQD